MAAKMTMAEVGRFMGLTEATVSRHETGDRRPSEQTLREYAELYKVPAEDLDE